MDGLGAFGLRLASHYRIHMGCCKGRRLDIHRDEARDELNITSGWPKVPFSIQQPDIEILYLNSGIINITIS